MIDSNLSVTSAMASEVKATATGGKKAFSPFSVDSLLSHRERVINNNSGAVIPRAVVLPQKQEADDDKEAESSEERSCLKSEEEQAPRGEIVHKAKEYPCASILKVENCPWY